jgi:hypothetical protein
MVPRRPSGFGAAGQWTRTIECRSSCQTVTKPKAVTMGFYKLDEDDLGYQVVLWNSQRDIPDRTLAAAVGVSIGLAAFYEAVVQYPAPRRIILKIGARVIRDTERHGREP